MKTFEQAWAEMKERGYRAECDQYDRYALEQVRLGWEMAMREINPPHSCEESKAFVHPDSLVTAIRCTDGRWIASGKHGSVLPIAFCPFCGVELPKDPRLLIVAPAAAPDAAACVGQCKRSAVTWSSPHGVFDSDDESVIHALKNEIATMLDERNADDDGPKDSLPFACARRVLRALALLPEAQLRGIR